MKCTVNRMLLNHLETFPPPQVCAAGRRGSSYKTCPGARKIGQRHLSNLTCIICKGTLSVLRYFRNALDLERAPSLDLLKDFKF